MGRLFLPLVEVRILHEFYLTDSNGATIFDQAAPADRLAFLAEQLRNNRPSINEKLAYSIPVAQQSRFDGGRLKLLHGYTGFKIMVAVEERPMDGGVMGYAPLISLPPEQPIDILLLAKNGSLDTISNTRFQHNLPATYFFTNRALSGPKGAPFLSLPAPARTALMDYEQGDITTDGGNTLQAFFINGAGHEDWLPLRGAGYVTESDRLLLPPRFTYRFPAGADIRAADFELANRQGDILYKSAQHVSGDGPVPIDVTNLSGIVPYELCTLQVSSSNGFSRRYPVLFAPPGLPDRSTWGLVSLLPVVPDDAFSLLDDTGLLRNRRGADGVMTGAPVFEICIRSRFSFWRYRNNKKQKIKKNTSLDPYLAYDQERGMLVSHAMRSASLAQVPFRDGTASRFMPNPGSYESIQVENGRVYTDIYVPRSDLFDV